MKRYRALVVPESGGVKAEDAAALDAYVTDGGRLLLSGRIPDALTCLGRFALKRAWPLRHSMYVRIRPEDKAELAVDGLKDFDLVHLRGDFYEYEPAAGTDQMLRLIHDVMYGPPEKCYYRSVSDIPALLVRKHGDGMAASFPFQIGAMHREWGNLGHPMLAVGTLDNLLQTGRRLRIESSPLVEATHRRDPKGRFEWIGLYNHSGRLENSFHPPIPIGNVRVSLKISRPIERVISLTNGAELTRTDKSSNEMEIILPKLRTFEIVLVEYAR